MPYRVKHLNPRQGITTYARRAGTGVSVPACETPKSPPGDYNASICKHRCRGMQACVKHLNPRQGITTGQRQRQNQQRRIVRCETPKSPPGDYNSIPSVNAMASHFAKCETPKSPPGDYNVQSAGRQSGNESNSVKHLNPRQGITTSFFLSRGSHICLIYV